MKRTLLRLTCGLVAAAPLLVVGAAPASVPTTSATPSVPAYAFTDLGVLGGLDSRGHALSSSGYAAGLADTSPGSWIFGFHAFLWEPVRPGATTGTIVDLGVLHRKDLSAATAVNASGVTVGVSLPPRGGSTAFVYDGSLRALPGLGGRLSSAADVNDRGQVVGEARLPNGHDHAVLWQPPRGADQSVVVVDLGRPAGRPATSATAVNERGLVVGSVADGDGYAVAAVWTPDRPHGSTGTWLELPTLPGATGSAAEDVNRSGVVVGQADPRRGDRGWLWDGRMHLLPPLPGGDATYAYGVNDAGDAVGYSNVADFSARAVLWHDGQAVDLNDLMPAWAVEAGYVLREAHEINDHGQVVGVASIGDHAHAFLLTPAGNWS
jgi:probable HAF family extracellular repeat protein